jgi:tetratricopeptide (TPR) repeat protein
MWYAEARTACRQAAAIYRELGDRRLEGLALSLDGTAYEAHLWATPIAPVLLLVVLRWFALQFASWVVLPWAGALKQAITPCQDAVVLSRKVGDRLNEGQALTTLGFALKRARRFKKAISAHRQAVEIYRELGDRHSEARALTELGGGLRQALRFRKAISAYRQAVEIYRELGDRHSERAVLTNLSLALRLVCRFKAASTADRQVVAISQELGLPHAVARQVVAWQAVKYWTFDADRLQEDRAHGGGLLGRR